MLDRDGPDHADLGTRVSDAASPAVPSTPMGESCRNFSGCMGLEQRPGPRCRFGGLQGRTFGGGSEP